MRALAPTADGEAQGAVDGQIEQRGGLVAQLVDDAVRSHGLVEHGPALLLEGIAEQVLERPVLVAMRP